MASVMEISASSSESFEDAIRIGLQRASRRVTPIHGAWVKDQAMDIANGQVTSFTVRLHVSFGRPSALS